MSNVCDTCGKRPRSGNNVSHSKRHTKRRFLPNIISKRIEGIKQKICAACLRTSKKPARTRKIKEAATSSES